MRSLDTKRSTAAVVFLLLAVAHSEAQTNPPPEVTNLSTARAVWNHDKLRWNYFDYWIDGQVRPDVATYQEMGPHATLPGEFVFHGKLPTDLQPGAHTFQVRACFGFGSGPCSNWLVVPFTVKADGTIDVPKTPGGGTVIQVTVGVTIR
jgi:hypothetical protein